MKYLKFISSLVLCFLPAVILSILAADWFFLATAKSSCNCPSELIGMARVAFEKNLHLVEAFFAVVLLLLSYFASKPKWTIFGAISLCLSFALACFVWDSSLGYSLVDPDSLRWFRIPVHSITPEPYTALSRILVFPVTTWRFINSLVLAILFFSVAQFAHYWWQRRKQVAAVGDDALA